MTFETFTPGGIQLKSGQILEADIIVTATGLQLRRLLGGMAVRSTATPVDLRHAFTYKGLMFSGVPNLAATFGYTNASWTLKADSPRIVCRLLGLDGPARVLHRVPAGVEPANPGSGETAGLAGLLLRLCDPGALSHLPSRAWSRPGAVYQNYALDLLSFRYRQDRRRGDAVFQGAGGPSSAPGHSVRGPGGGLNGAFGYRRVNRGSLPAST